jgi:hypothetical protein
MIANANAPQWANSTLTNQQVFRFFNSAVDKKPAKVTDARVVKQSGYEQRFTYFPAKKLQPDNPEPDFAQYDYIVVHRIPKAVLGADKGLVEDPKGWWIIYVPLE